MQLQLCTKPVHSVVLNGTTEELLGVKTALGKFSQRDFARMGLTTAEIKLLEQFHTDLNDMVTVLNKAVIK